MNVSPNMIRIFSHILFWVLWYIYRLTSTLSGKSLKGLYWWGDMSVLHVLLVDIAIMVLFSYGLIYFIIPKFLDTKKYILFFLTFILWYYFIAAIYSAIFLFHLEQIYTVFIWNDKESVSTMFKRLTNIPFLFSLFSNFMVPALVLGVIKFYKNKVQLSKIEEEKNRMELRVLKNQLNPHFLFNTLNNLYSYVVIQSPKAPEMVLQLSGILDYALYKSQEKYVPLKEEIRAIENFMGLEKIRYGERLKITYENQIKNEMQVSPLLLLSIVENAFKHGASGDIASPCIKIFLAEKNGGIELKVWNTKSKKVGELNDAYKKGIGLSNIKRQLNLIYPDQYSLIIDDNADYFNIILYIKESSKSI